jgi:hypothetical protein
MNNIEFFSSIFSDSPSPRVSNKYQFIRTSDVLESLSDLGWTPRTASEVRARKEHTKGFQKHLIRLSNPEFSPVKEVGSEVPEIILTNSHDGKNSFSFRIGIYRMVCSNGLVIPTEEFSNVTIKHIGSMASQIKEVVEKIHNNFSEVYLDIEKMKKRDLTSKEINEFSRRALESRSLSLPPSLSSDPRQILNPQRKEDEGKDLWRIYNRAQENLTWGNFEIKTKKGSRRAVPLRSITKNIRMNEGLWNLAKSYL